MGPVEGGPDDDSVIPSFMGHIASRMIGDVPFVRGLLRCHNRSSVMATLRDWYGRMRPTAVALVDGTGLAHLRFSLFYHLDAPLLCTFIERWQPDTNSFHLSFGEMTVMLHDVYWILRIPITGQLLITLDTPSDVVRDMGVLMARPIVQGDIHGGAIAVSKVTQAYMHEEIPDAE